MIILLKYRRFEAKNDIEKFLVQIMFKALQLKKYWAQHNRTHIVVLISHCKRKIGKHRNIE